MTINKRQIVINLLCFASGWLLGVLYLHATLLYELAAITAKPSP